MSAAGNLDSPMRPGLVKRASSAGASAFKLANAIWRAPVTTPDGLTAAQAKAPSDQVQQRSLLYTAASSVVNGTSLNDLHTLLQAVTEAGSSLDDRKLLLEHVVIMLQGMPDNAAVQSELTNSLVKMLWEDLNHPPTMFVGKDRFRTADGSRNNIAMPDLGRAGTPYAKSVPACRPTPTNLPAPSVVFDALLKRRKFTPHPSGISCFQTSTKDRHINETSSYLDLSPLYGNNQEEQDKVRTKRKGEIWPDVIASERLMLMPPSVAALLIAFSRNHNFIAHRLAQINEGGWYKEWNDDPSQAEAMAKQDDHIFNTARLVNCGWFMQIIFYDYIRVILHLNETESTWSLVPTSNASTLVGKAAPRGTGNAVSLEFSLLYRWHSSVSEKEEKWLEDLFAAVSDKDPATFTPADLKEATDKLKGSQKHLDEPRYWDLAGLKRDPETGKFDDDALAQVLADATEDIAGAFGARGSPAAMRIIDIMGIALARNDWNCCSLNEFRRFLNLKPYTTFSEWNSDPEIARVAEQLYVHPDNLELFVGLHAEEAKPSMSGSGLAPGYTISRAILSDAVALTRADRFLTTDFNAGTFTSWGYEDCQPDTIGGSYGGMIGRLLMRAFPKSYRFNSTYALFPLTTPDTTIKNLQRFGKLPKYNTTRPSAAPLIKSVKTYDACIAVLQDFKSFNVFYDEAIRELTKGHKPFFIASDKPETHNADRALIAHALFPVGWEERIKHFYATTTQTLIDNHAYTFDQDDQFTKTYYLDVVRDVSNMVPVYWVANQFGIPLKSAVTPHAVMTPSELYGLLCLFFVRVFMNFSAEPGFKIREMAEENAKLMQTLIGLRLSQTSGMPVVVEDLASKLQSWALGSDETQGLLMGKESAAFYRRLLSKDGNRSLDDLNALVQCTMTASVANQGEAAAHVINFYLDDKQKVHYDALCRLAQDDSDESDRLVRGYILEALRLDPQVPFIPRVAKVDKDIQDGDRVVHVKAGEFMFPSLKNAGRDEKYYPNPDQVDPLRPTVFRGFGVGMHECIGSRIVHHSLVATIKSVFRLKNLRRAPGQAGKLKRFWEELAETTVPVYISTMSTPTPLPPSLVVCFDQDQV
ncbi:hypothetical protein OIO90_001813 [Microbotryomycetes sp. JL221]|nr:hypothetical protein OIO90_001813 [Microbotryomycetes sp. JL221]